MIDGCIKDDRKCQEKLYRSYYRSMMNLCLRYTGSEADAMEVLNTGFYKAFKNLSSYDPHKGVFYTWISTIIIRSCIDHIKARGKIRENYSLNHVAERTVPAEIIEHLKLNELLACLKKLPRATSAVFNLYVIEGYSHKEIGKLLDIKEGTSKWHLSEARRLLQQQVKMNE